jgi:hypothetical protein
LTPVIFSLGEGLPLDADTDPFVTLVRAVAMLHTSDKCFYCNTAGCRTTTCTKFQELLTDPRRLERLQRILSAVQKRSNPAPTKVPSYPRRVNQVIDSPPLDPEPDDVSLSSDTTLAISNAIHNPDIPPTDSINGPFDEPMDFQ